MAALIWLRIVAAAVIGFAAWQGHLWAIPLSLIAPCLIAVQPSRAAAGLTAFAYYAAASTPVIAVSRAYWPANPALGVALWLGAAAILSTPFILFWTDREAYRPWVIPAALIASTLPPLCIIGWASPLTAAGVLFPGAGWCGLAATLLIPSLLAVRRTRAVATVAAALLCIVANSIFRPPALPSGWTALNTDSANSFEADEEHPRRHRDLHRASDRDAGRHSPSMDRSDDSLLGTDAPETRPRPKDSRHRRRPTDPRHLRVPQRRADRRPREPKSLRTAHSSPLGNVEALRPEERRSAETQRPGHHRDRNRPRRHPDLLRTTPRLANPAFGAQPPNSPRGYCQSALDYSHNNPSTTAGMHEGLGPPFWAAFGVGS